MCACSNIISYDNTNGTYIIQYCSAALDSKQICTPYQRWDQLHNKISHSMGDILFSDLWDIIAYYGNSVGRVLTLCWGGP